jgi:hypothetical protein
MVSLDAPEEYTTISLLTIDGKEVWKKTIDSSALKSTQFDIGKENTMYLLKVSSGDLVFTETLVVSQK